MTPKEKAEQLISNMYNTEHCGITHFPSKKYCDCSEMNIYQAKQCALIAVDEIIEEVVESADNEVKFMRVIYWEKVKQEINNL